MTVFERIIKREIPAYIVYEDELVIAFLDISQVTKGHTLVVPKKVYKDVFELDDEIAGHLFKVAVKLSKGIKKAFKAEGLNIVNNNGSEAGQEVFHYHIHLIPRCVGDDYRIRGINHGDMYSKDAFNEMKEAIINAI